MNDNGDSYLRRMFGNVTHRQLLMVFICLLFYSLFFGWTLALTLVGAMFFHEFGHATAMIRYGQRIAGFYALPPFGLAVATTDPWPSRKAEAVIALMGPAWGLAMSLVVYLSYLWTGNPIIAGLTGWIALLNLFNLIPMNPMDGGRVVKCLAFSVSTAVGFISLVAGLLLTAFLAFTWIPLVGLLVLLMGIIEFRREIREYRRQKDRELMIAALAVEFGVEPTVEAVLAALDDHVRKTMATEGEDLAEQLGCEMHPDDAGGWDLAAKGVRRDRIGRLVCLLADLRTEYRTIFSSAGQAVTSVEELAPLPYDGDISETPLGKFLRAASRAPMRAGAMALVFLAYGALIGALGWLTFKGLSVMGLIEVIKALR